MSDESKLKRELQGIAINDQSKALVYEYLDALPHEEYSQVLAVIVEAAKKENGTLRMLGGLAAIAITDYIVSALARENAGEYKRPMGDNLESTD